MILPKGHRLLITRTPNWEGLVYEAAYENNKYSLAVNSENDTKILVKKIQFGFTSGLLLTFKSSNDLLLARINLQTSHIDFSLPSGEPKGCVLEASWSLIGKSIVEDENNQKLGWIDYGFKKDRIFSGDGLEIGFIIRSFKNKLPWFLTPSQAHLVERFEFFNEGGELDERLLFAWICRKVFAEKIHRNR